MSGQTTTLLLFEHSFDRGNLTAKTIYWNETRVDEWKDVSGIPNSADINFRGMNKVWYIKNFPVVAGQEYKLQLRVNVPIGTFTLNCSLYSCPATTGKFLIYQTLFIPLKFMSAEFGIPETSFHSSTLVSFQ